jgi:hypothetical protein
MTSTQKTQATKTSATKGASKAKVKPFALILRNVLEGKYADNVQRYYVRALENHQAKGTNFPRAQCATAELPKAVDVVAMFDKGEVYKPANKTGQRVFDEMVNQMFGSRIPKATK